MVAALFFFFGDSKHTELRDIVLNVAVLMVAELLHSVTTDGRKNQPWEQSNSSLDCFHLNRRSELVC